MSGYYDPPPLAPRAGGALAERWQETGPGRDPKKFRCRCRRARSSITGLVVRQVQAMRRQQVVTAQASEARFTLGSAERPGRAVRSRPACRMLTEAYL